MKKLIFTFIALSLLCCKCRKDTPVEPPAPSLPPATQEGKNTFGCLVNGEIWLPKGGGLVPSIASSYGNGSFFVRATNVSIVPRPYINLNAGYVFKDTIISIANYNDTAGFQNFYYSEDLTFYYPINGKIGQLHLTKLDSTNRIISGTFWFDAIDTASGEIIQLREGRFDIKY